MAEGGEDSKDNPFSFKKFVKKKETSDEQSASDGSKEDEEDILDIPDIQAEGRRVNNRRLPVVADDGKMNKRKEKEDENPFSFKKFLKSAGGSSKNQPSGKANMGDISTLDLANDLPDFVQHHFTGDIGSRHARIQPIPDVPLPDFALDSGSPRAAAAAVPFDPLSPLSSPDHSAYHPPNLLDHYPPHNNEGGTRPRTRPNRTFPLDEPFVTAALPNGDIPENSIHEDDRSNDANSDEETVPVQQAHSTGGLPDFLSDSAVNSCSIARAHLENSLAHSDDLLYQHNGDYSLELRRIQDENRELRAQLEEARQFSERESKRVAKVVQEMEAIERREAEDTKALENMVQQVEGNLQATTARAVAAENTITKLRQEVRSIQNQLKAVQLENEALRKGEGTPSVIREKAKYASEQLGAAAKTAEIKLNDLLSGLDQLKLVADVLASIDKITENKSDADHQGAPNEAEGATGGADGQSQHSRSATDK